MATTIGPFFSEEARGTIAKALNFQVLNGKIVARKYFKPTYKNNTAQETRRNWFLGVINHYQRMVDEERFLWKLVLLNIKDYNDQKIKQTNRTWRCQLSSQILSTFSYVWNFSPFPPELKQWLADDDIANFEQLKSDTETLTGLTFCFSVKAFFFPYLGIVTTKDHPGLGKPVGGQASGEGVAIALDKDYWDKLNTYGKTELVAHELTHAIMSQHGYNARNKTIESETIASQCAERIRYQDLTPIYKYQDKTLSEIVPYENCS